MGFKGMKGEKSYSNCQQRGGEPLKFFLFAFLVEDNYVWEELDKRSS